MHDVSIDFGDRIQCTAALCGTSDALFVLATAWMRGERWVVLQLQLEAAQPDDPREAQRVIVARVLEYSKPPSRRPQARTVSYLTHCQVPESRDVPCLSLSLPARGVNKACG